MNHMQTRGDIGSVCLATVGRGERRSREANTTAIARVEDRVEALQECHTVDEVETSTAGRTDVVDDEENAALLGPNRYVEAPLQN